MSEWTRNINGKYNKVLNKKKYLVIGGDSKVGIGILTRCRKERKKVMYTTRRRLHPDKDALYLDLSDDPEIWTCPDIFKIAFFCAAITSMEYCRRYVKKSRDINVGNSLDIMKKVAATGTSVLYLSSNQVFGECNYPTENDLISPLNEYGWQKSKVEKNLGLLAGGHAIVRATKIIDKNFNLFVTWIKSLKLGRCINAFTDYYFSPVPMDYVARLLVKIADHHHKSGIWHVSGDRQISYYEAALLIARKINVDTDLVKGVSAGRFIVDYSNNQAPVLQCKRIKAEFGFKPPDVIETIEGAIV